MSCLQLFSCNKSEEATKNISDNNWLSLQFAQGFDYKVVSDSLILRLKNSTFTGTTQQKIALNPKKIVCLSSTFLPYLKALGIQDRLIATGEKQYISDSSIRRRIEKGEVKSLDTQSSPDLEWYLVNKPDLVITYLFSASDSLQINQLKQTGTPVLILQPFEEPHPVGRVEWIKPLGRLFNKPSLADSIFTQISSDYQKLKVEPSQKAPNVLSGSPYEGVWWVPGGSSLSAQLIKDAGGIYIFADDTHKVAFATDFEGILAQSQKIDIWINTNPFRTIDEITQWDSRLAYLKALKEARIFNHEKSKKEWGADDFYEEGVFRPDLVLADLKQIFNGDSKDSLLHFYRRLK